MNGKGELQKTHPTATGSVTVSAGHRRVRAAGTCSCSPAFELFWAGKWQGLAQSRQQVQPGPYLLFHSRSCILHPGGSTCTYMAKTSRPTLQDSKTTDKPQSSGWKIAVLLELLSRMSSCLTCQDQTCSPVFGSTDGQRDGLLLARVIYSKTWEGLWCQAAREQAAAIKSPAIAFQAGDSITKCKSNIKAACCANCWLSAAIKML